jgi:hypothetical protein
VKIRNGKNLSISVIVLSLLIINVPARAQTPESGFSTPTGFDSGLGKKVKLDGDCFGRTDFPHISTHIPFTVNVHAVTHCPGQKVTVRTVLLRHSWWIFNEVQKMEKSGFGDVEVNVALPCKWKKGQPAIEYTAYSYHNDSVMEVAGTKVVKLINC